MSGCTKQDVECVCWLLCRAAEMMTQTGTSVTLKVAKQAAVFYGLSLLLNQTQQLPNANWR